jgi:hypothetical protein
MPYLRMFRMALALGTTATLLVACASTVTESSALRRACNEGPFTCTCPNSLNKGTGTCTGNVASTCVCTTPVAPTDVDKFPPKADPGTNPAPGADPTPTPNDTCEGHATTVTYLAPLALNKGTRYLYNQERIYHDDESQSCSDAKGPDGVASYKILASGILHVWLDPEQTDPAEGDAVLSVRKGDSCATTKELACRVMSAVADPNVYVPVKQGDRIFVHWDFTKPSAGAIVINVKLEN